jgi:hypothetical protein
MVTVPIVRREPELFFISMKPTVFRDPPIQYKSKENFQ